ncbi:MAG: hypothetical protein FWF51_01295 [Chitinivibrionia bacterium]|nr:hypothetical protein [Chitinivibrionia bacterium]
MANKEKSPHSDGDCKACKYRGATFQNLKVYCNDAKILVAIQHCKHYEKDSGIVEMLSQKSESEYEAEAISEKTETIENESLNNILEFFTGSCEWTNLRKILTKDALSTTVLLNYLEYNSTAKKKFMNALITMAQNELKNADSRT